MIKYFKLLTIAVVLSAAAAAPIAAAGEQELSTSTNSRIITDMAGRTNELPVEINRIFCKSPMATIMLYTLAPEKLLGWNYKFTENEAALIPAKYRDLPVLGGWFGRKNTANIEEIVAMEPDIILDMDFINAAAIEADDILQKQTGIPVILVDGSGFERFADVYRFTGELINSRAPAEMLAEYCEKTLDEIKNVSSAISDDQRITVYYAEGPEGLQTEAAGSRSTELIRLVGALDSTAPPGSSNSFKINVSLEQVMLWNPDVIVTAAAGGGSPPFLIEEQQNQGWKVIDAVKNNRIYFIPQNPFGWFDRPASVNGLIGIKWLAEKLYPEQYDYDIASEVKKFYSLFYHIELNSIGLQQLLNQ